jgi:hypothetical protein
VKQISLILEITIDKGVNFNVVKDVLTEELRRLGAISTPSGSIYLATSSVSHRNKTDAARRRAEKAGLVGKGGNGCRI